MLLTETGRSDAQAVTARLVQLTDGLGELLDDQLAATLRRVADALGD